MSYWNVKWSTYNSIEGHYFDLLGSVSVNVNYRSIDNQNKIVLAETIFLRSIEKPFSSPANYHSQNSPANYHSQNLCSLSFTTCHPSFNVINFQSVQFPSILNYWMILPEILDNPFAIFKSTEHVSSVKLNPFNFEINHYDTIKDIYDGISNENYALDTIELRNIFDSHDLNYILRTTVRCISNCIPKQELISVSPKQELISVSPKQELISVSPKQELSIFIVDPGKNQFIPEPSSIFSLIFIFILCCSRIIKR